MQLKIDIPDNEIADVSQMVSRMNVLLSCKPDTAITYRISGKGMTLIFTKKGGGPIRQHKEEIDFESPHSMNLDSAYLMQVVQTAKYLHEYAIDGAWMPQCMEEYILSYKKFYKDDGEASTTFGVTSSNDDLARCYEIIDQKGALKLVKFKH